jgi:hypothetical protein
MENFLLLFDELDDAVRSLRILWSQILGFAIALALFAVTILVIMNWPLWTLAVVTVAALLRALAVFTPAAVLRTDP